MISEVYNEDCMIGMKRYPDKYFNLAIVDLEYNIGASKPSIKPCTVKQRNGSELRVKQPNYIPKEWDLKKSSPEYFNELFRVSERQIIFGGNYYGLEGGYLVWDKLNGESDQFGCELAWVSFSKRTDIVYYMWAGMFQGVYCGRNLQKALIQQGNKSLNERRIHPTQKPVILYSWMLKEYANSGDIILDTHLGSGSHRIAADKAGLSFIAFESDKDYFIDQNERFYHYKRQTVLSF